MTKRKIKKAVVAGLIKENKSHQEVFDHLKSECSDNLDVLAEEIAKIPSVNKQNKNKNLVYTYVALLGLVIILRSLNVIGLALLGTISTNFILLMIAISVIIPILGIYGAMTRRTDSYKVVSFILIMSIVRSIPNASKGVGFDSTTLLSLIPLLVAIGLGFYIPSRLKMNYSKKLVKTDVDGKTMKHTEYVFESDGLISNDDLLDTEIIP